MSTSDTREFNLCHLLKEHPSGRCQYVKLPKDIMHMHRKIDTEHPKSTTPSNASIWTKRGYVREVQYTGSPKDYTQSSHHHKENNDNQMTSDNPLIDALTHNRSHLSIHIMREAHLTPCKTQSHSRQNRNPCSCYQCCAHDNAIFTSAVISIRYDRSSLNATTSPFRISSQRK